MVTLRFRARTVDVDVESDARVLCLFGPSGSGKTTCLEVVAGLLRPDGGAVVFEGRDLAPRPARERGVGYLPQDAPLFPHLSVRENLLYGDPGGDPAAVAEALGIAHLLDRAPRRLSGGEQRRVALGRAIQKRPRILLLDEPFSGLEAPLRARLLSFVARLEVPRVVLVTHDPRDAMGLADEVVRLADGRVAERGPPDAVFGPRSPLVEPAALVGGRVARADAPHAEVDVAGRTVFAHLPDARPDESVRLAVRADEVTIALHRHDDLSAKNQIDATVERIEERGAQRLAFLDAGFRLYALLDPRSVEALDLAPGRAVVCQFKAAAVKRAGL